jgi:hypothetical protein
MRQSDRLEPGGKAMRGRDLVDLGDVHPALPGLADAGELIQETKR